MKTDEISTQDIKNVADKVRSLFSDEPSIEFKPFAMFDEPLDCIRVIVRECSITETRINSLLTVLEDNYPEPEQQKYVGFTIKGARHFCISQKLPSSGAVSLTAILDQILKTFPEPVVDLCVNAVARTILMLPLCKASFCKLKAGIRRIY